MQQAEFLIGELDVAAVDPDPAARQIDVEAVYPNRRAVGVAAAGDRRQVGGFPRTPQQRPHPGDELPHAERLGQVVVGAALETDHFVRLFVPRRQHQDRHVAVHRAAAHRAAQRDAVEPGQHNVEHEQIEANGFRALERRRAVGRAFARVALEPEVQADELADVRLVFDDEHAWRGRHRFFTVHPLFVHSRPVQSSKETDT